MCSKNKDIKEVLVCFEDVKKSLDQLSLDINRGTFSGATVHLVNNIRQKIRLTYDEFKSINDKIDLSKIEVIKSLTLCLEQLAELQTITNQFIFGAITENTSNEVIKQVDYLLITILRFKSNIKKFSSDYLVKLNK